MLDASCSDSENEPVTENQEIVEWDKEPLEEVPDADQGRGADRYLPPPVDQWCRCGKCQPWETQRMNVCCRDHAIWNTKRQHENINCIAEAEDVQDLMKPAPLRVMFQNYCSSHNNTFPDAEKLKPGSRYTAADIHRLLMKQRRLSAYRSLVFWTYPDIKKRQRYPLPSCVYGMVRAMFPPTDNEEEFADWVFSEYKDLVDDE
jgi:hypothetical protein